MKQSAADIAALLTAAFGPEAVLEIQATPLMQVLVVPATHLTSLCRYLRDTEGLYFDMLNLITSVDQRAEHQRFGVFYTLYSIPYGHSLTLKVWLTADAPEVPTVCQIWRAAEWHEREAYDLMGIRFTDHPDLRRMFLPDDWVGHPLRKDYETPDTYHGLTVAAPA
jgi:NADH-quinone oxidoreductase subunit C